MKELANRWTTGYQIMLGGVLVGILVLGTGCNTFGKKKQPGLLSNRAGKIPPPYTEPLAPPPPTPPPAPPARAFVPPPPPRLPPPPPAPAPAPRWDVAVPERVIMEPIEKVPVDILKMAPEKGAIKQPPKVQSKIASYQVKAGDYLYKIAWQHHVSVDELAAFNKMKKTEPLRVGKTLQIPPGGHFDAKRPLPKPKIPVVKKHEAPTAAPAPAVPVAAPSAPEAGAALAAPEAGVAPTPAAAEGGSYTVQKNDNLWTIAKKLNVKSADIKSANKLKSSALQIGQVLVIPGLKTAGGAAPAAAAPAAAPAAPAIPDVAAPPSAAGVPAAGGETKAAAPAVAGFPNTLEHTVLDGETLESIAEMYETQMADILKANPQIKSNADLKPNLTIVVPYK